MFTIIDTYTWYFKIAFFKCPFHSNLEPLLIFHPTSLKLEQLWMRKFQCFLLVLKRSCICYYIIYMTVPLNNILKIDLFLFNNGMEASMYNLRFFKIDPIIHCIKFIWFWKVLVKLANIYDLQPLSVKWYCNYDKGFWWPSASISYLVTPWVILFSANRKSI